MFPNMFDGDTFWLPSQSLDVYMKYWDAWYGRAILRGQADFFFTDTYFHPIGMSLSFHNFSLPHMLAYGALQQLLPADAAYGLTHLLTIFANVLSAYVILLAWFSNRWAALAGAAIFGMHPFIIHHPHNVESVFLVTVPLALYAFDRGIKARHKLWLAASACLIGVTALIGMYTFVCLLILIGIYTLWLAPTFWRNFWFWRYLALVLSLAAVVSMIRIYPMLVNSEGLDEALEKSYSASGSADLLEFVVNPRHPHTGSIFSAVFDNLPLHADSGHSYFGFICYAVMAYALIAGSSRRRLLPWLAALLFFALMRLGATLIINGQVYEHIRMPGAYLTDGFPWLFRAFWEVQHYLIGMFFPSAVLIAYGLDQLAARLALRWRPIAILALLLLCVYERYQLPDAGQTIPQTHLRFIDWLATEPDQDDIHLINLPMGRKWSKVYGFYQTFNGYPQAEGLAARTPAASYDYMDKNLLLQSWRQQRPIRCLPSNDLVFRRDLQQLLSDGFSHVVLHHKLEDLASLPRTFDHAPAAYSDDRVTIYRLESLVSACDSTALLNSNPRPSLPLLLDDSLPLPRQSAAILSIHSAELEDGKLLDYYAGLSQATSELLFIHTEDLRAGATPQTDSLEPNPRNALAANQIVILAYAPLQTDPDLAADYRSWVARDFKSCGSLVDSDALLLELFLPPVFPCELVEYDEFDDVEYDSGHRLGHLILRQNDTGHVAFFRWDRIPWQKHSVSIQLFNAAGEKAYNQDFVIRRRSLNYHRIDTAGLPPGDYQLKLVVYDFESGVSVPGVLKGDGARFERELQIASLAME